MEASWLGRLALVKTSVRRVQAVADAALAELHVGWRHAGSAKAPKVVHRQGGDTGGLALSDDATGAMVARESWFGHQLELR